MEIRAHSKYIRTTPRKARLVARAVRYLSLEQALATLDRINKKAAGPIKKTIESGIANAENNAKLSRENLYIKALFVDEGPRFKRWRAASRGSAHPYAKNTSHITVVLDEITGSGKKKAVKNVSKTEKKSESVKEVAAPKKKAADASKKYDTKMKDQTEMKSQKQTSKGVTPRKVIGGGN